MLCSHRSLVADRRLQQLSGIVFLLLFSQMQAAFAQTPEQIRIAVLRIASRGEITFNPDILADRLRGRLVNTNAFIVASRVEMDRILSEQRLQLSGVTTSESAARAGRLLNVDKIVIGSIGKLGRTFSLNLVVIDVESGRIDRSFQKNHRGSSERLLRLIDEIADEIVEVMGTRRPVAGRVTVVAEPADAEIQIDARPFARGELLQAEIEPGDHELRVVRAGYLPHEERFVVAPGQSLEFNVSMREIFRLRIRSTPSRAAVFINGRSVGTTPLARRVAEGMRLNVRVEYDGYQAWESEITIQDDVELSPRLRSELVASRTSSSKAWLWVLGGLSTAGAAAYFVLAQDKTETTTAEPLPPLVWPPTDK